MTDLQLITEIMWEITLCPLKISGVTAWSALPKTGYAPFNNNTVILKKKHRLCLLQHQTSSPPCFSWAWPLNPSGRRYSWMLKHAQIIWWRMFRNYPALAPSSVNNMMCLFPCRPVRLAAISGPERSLSWGGDKLVAERAGVCHFWFAQGGQRAPTCAPLSHIPDWITRRTKSVSASQRDKIAVQAPTHRD